MEIIVIILMSLFCMGLFISMQEGHIFSFVRQPVVDILEAAAEMHKAEIRDVYNEYSEKKSKMLVNFCETVNGPDQNELAKRQLKLERDMRLKQLDKEHHKTIVSFNWLKPLVLCGWCFASTYGSLVFWSLHIWYFKDASVQLIPLYFVSVFGCLVLNAFIDSILRNLKAY